MRRIVAAIRVEKGARFLLLVRTARNANRMKGSGREWTRAEKKGIGVRKRGEGLGKEGGETYAESEGGRLEGRESDR